MNDSLHVISSRALDPVRESLNKGKISIAMDHFRAVTLNAPLPVIFTVYSELKSEMTAAGDDSRKKFNVFNDLFLRMLEERGETSTDIYRSVLRDSAEYTYLNRLFSSKIPQDRLEKPKKIKDAVILKPKPEVITLKKILSRREQSLLDFSVGTWYDLVELHLAGITEESVFVKKSSRLVRYVDSNPQKETFHLELVIAYIFERLLEYSELSTRSKDFAMQAMNLMTAREKLWSKLHGQYQEIIRK
ncbi:MAG TPA: hypothetical protein PK514_14670 [Spirochaetota bacterium]|nr:hypothetical protein [Spirochaetota bacterium]